MQFHRPLHLFSVLRRHAHAVGVCAGITASLVWLWHSALHHRYTLAQWDVGAVPLIVAHTMYRISDTRFDAVFLGSSQIAQVHPGMISNATGKTVLVSAIPGGDVAYILAMTRAIAAYSTSPPLIVAEFSRYVASDIERLVHRDTLAFIPCPFWADTELPTALYHPIYRPYYSQGVLNSLVPFVRHRESIKALAMIYTPALAACILSSHSRPAVVRRYSIPHDGHGGPYPYRPVRPGPFPAKRPALSADKQRCWRQLLALHRQGRIRLALFIPPFHSCWRSYYGEFYHGTNSPAASLLQEMQAANVPCIDCTSLMMVDADCMDAHHFTLSGMTKLTAYVSSNLLMLTHK